MVQLVQPGVYSQVSFVCFETVLAHPDLELINVVHTDVEF